MPDNVLAQWGPLRLYAFGAAAGLGFLAAGLAAGAAARERGIPPRVALAFVALSMPVALVGARLGFVLVNLPDFRHEPLAALQLGQGGLSFHGGMLAVLWLARRFAARLRLGFWSLGDALAPAAALGQAIGMVGLDVAGRPTPWPWALWADGEPVHPHGAYGILLYYGLFLLLGSRLRRAVFEGQVLLTYLLLQPAIVFVLGFFRAGERIWGLELGQWTSLVLFTVALAVWDRRAPGAPRLWPLPEAGSLGTAALRGALGLTGLAALLGAYYWRQLSWF